MEPAVKVLLVVAVAFVAISLWRSRSSREPFANWIGQEFQTVPPTPFVVPRPPLIVSDEVTAAPTPAPTPGPLTPSPTDPTPSPVPVVTQVLTQVGTDSPAVVPTMVPTMVPNLSEAPSLVTTHLGASPLMTA